MSGRPRGAAVAGFLGRCPACGRGPLFKGFLTVVPACAACGQDLSGQDSGDGPVAFIILVAGFIVLGAALVVEVRYGWPVWLHLLVWLPLALALCLGMMRPLKGALIGLQFKHRRDEFGA